MDDTLKRNGLYIIITSVFLVIFYSPLRDLLSLSRSEELYSHLIFIPIVSLYLIYSDRKAIFADTNFSPYGIILILISVSFLIVGINRREILGQHNYLSLTTLSVVIWWMGVFIIIHGLGAYRKASFPLFFLIFMVPPPSIIMDNIILSLQLASTEVSHIFFKLINIPIYREGFIFHLPEINLEIAKQCGGIRSTTVLVVLSVLFGHIFLKKWWAKIILILSVFPISVIKNGFRIITLYLLAVHVDKSILDSIAHRRGGYPFFLLGLAEMWFVIWVIKKFERRGVNSQ